MSYFNPFSNLTGEQIVKILETGLIKGKPISERQEFHLRTLAKQLHLPVQEKQEVLAGPCIHPEEFILVTISGRKFCKSCHKAL